MNKLKFTPGDVIKDTETGKCFRVLESNRKFLITNEYSAVHVVPRRLNVIDLCNLNNNEFDRYVVEKSIFDYESQQWVLPDFNQETRSNFYSDKTVIRVIRFNPHNGNLEWELECKWDLSKGNPTKGGSINLIVDNTNIPISVPLSSIADEMVNVFIYDSKEDNMGQNITDYLSRITFKESEYLSKNRFQYGYLVCDNGIWGCRYAFNHAYDIHIEVQPYGSTAQSMITCNIRDFIGDNPKVILLPSFDKRFPARGYPKKWQVNV